MWGNNIPHIVYAFKKNMDGIEGDPREILRCPYI